MRIARTDILNEIVCFNELIRESRTNLGGVDCRLLMAAAVKPTVVVGKKNTHDMHMHRNIVMTRVIGPWRRPCVLASGKLPFHIRFPFLDGDCDCFVQRPNRSLNWITLRMTVLVCGAHRHNTDIYTNMP